MINNCVFPSVFLCMHTAVISVCEGINGQTYVISLDGYALIRKTITTCMWGGGVSLSQVEAGGTKYSQL